MDGCPHAGQLGLPARLERPAPGPAGGEHAARRAVAACVPIALHDATLLLGGDRLDLIAVDRVEVLERGQEGRDVRRQLLEGMRERLIAGEVVSRSWYSSSTWLTCSSPTSPAESESALRSVNVRSFANPCPSGGGAGLRPAPAPPPMGLNQDCRDDGNEEYRDPECGQRTLHGAVGRSGEPCATKPVALFSFVQDPLNQDRSIQLARSPVEWPPTSTVGRPDPSARLETRRRRAPESLPRLGAPPPKEPSA
jgi:hypothetical protein